jgi:UDPglucose--hexose-1-phosphate uridylyltransferase
MSQLRRAPILGRWVIISGERTHRPTDFRPRRDFRLPEGFCPFCPGNEYTTPPEVLSYRGEARGGDGGDWSLRVVPNKFPALVIEGDLSPSSCGALNKSMNGIGAHEVIIETPAHGITIPSMENADVSRILQAMTSRISDLSRDERFAYVMAFKNHGPSAGATLEHPHSQLIALPVIPKQIEEEMNGARLHHERTGGCVYCSILGDELAAGSRVVDENEHFAAICPFAPAFSFETWILPKEHASSFERSPGQSESLAALLRSVIGRMERALGRPDYNFVLHNAPLRAPDLDFYHWHLEIIPRTGQVAGFEWGSGFFINPTAPEEAAAFLRDAGPA